MSDLQATNALTNGSSILEAELGLLLKERDDKYRRDKGMLSLEGMSIPYHIETTILEQADMDTEISTGVRCSLCGNNTIISYQVQVRAGDEGTNTFYRCTSKSCGNSYIGK
jgi:DNA-directed RNA polymerase subunit M/transcription elongation factor TFIIS